MDMLDNSCPASDGRGEDDVSHGAANEAQAPEREQDSQPGAEPVTADGPDHWKDRVFLVVVDDSEEWRSALRFACGRAAHIGGRVALLHVLERGEFQHFAGVAELMKAEFRQEAEDRLARVGEEVQALSGRLPEIHLREGLARDEVVSLINDDPAISILVLGARTGSDGPGPLITYLTTKGLGRLRVPITIVPDTIEDTALSSLV